jgi:hypothetical protein
VPVEERAGPCTRRMAVKPESEDGRRRFKRRKAIVEPVYGWIKQVLGFRAFSMRGPHYSRPTLSRLSIRLGSPPSPGAKERSRA